jgi:hypothetical protein
MMTPRQHVDWLPQHCFVLADLHHDGFYLGGGFGPAHIGTAIRPIGEMPHTQPRLKTATNVVGVICSSEPHQPLVVLSQRKQRQCVLIGRSGIPTEVGVGPCPAEGLGWANGENASPW